MDIFFNTINRVELQVKKDLQKEGVPFEEVTVQVTVGRTRGVSAQVWVNDEITASVYYLAVTSVQQMCTAIVKELTKDWERTNESNT